jgi:hypothetical protein
VRGIFDWDLDCIEAPLFEFLESLVLSVVKGEMKRKELMPKRMVTGWLLG